MNLEPHCLDPLLLSLRLLLLFFFSSGSPPSPRSGELRTQKLKSHLVRTHSLSVLLLKPGVGQYVAIHATLTARDFFLPYFYPSGPLTCILFPKLRPISPVFAVANTWFLCGLTEENRSPCRMQVPMLSACGI